MGGWDAPWHWVILAIVVIALFGYKKMPDAARSVGRSLRIFKTEIKGMTEDDKKREEAAPKQVEGTTPAAVVQPTAQPAPAQPIAPAQPAPQAQPVAQAQPVSYAQPVQAQPVPQAQPNSGAQ